MRFRVRLMAATVAAATCVTFGLTAAVPAMAASDSPAGFARTGATVKNIKLLGCLFANASVNGGVAKRQACDSSLQGEQWTITRDADGELKNGFNQCLGEQSGSTAAGANLVVTACQNPVAPTQEWSMIQKPNGYLLSNDKSKGDEVIHAVGTTGVNQEPASDSATLWTKPAS